MTEHFESWFYASKYAQVILPTEANKQIAKDGWKAATEQSHLRIAELEEQLAAQQALVVHLIPHVKMSDKGQEELAAIKVAEYQRGVDSCAISTAAAYEGGKQSGREERDKELMGQAEYELDYIGWTYQMRDGRWHLCADEPISHAIRSRVALSPNHPLFRKPFPAQKPLSGVIVKCTVCKKLIPMAEVGTHFCEAAHGITEKE
jgi:hypothetical protein